MSFTGFSNSVLVGCFKFQCSVGCETSIFFFYLLLRPRLHVISYSHLRSSAERSSSPRGRAEKKRRRKEKKHFKRLCNKEMGSGPADRGEREEVLALLCVCAPPQAYQMWRLRETISTDGGTVEYKLCQTLFQGDCSINTDGRRRRMGSGSSHILFRAVAPVLDAIHAHIYPPSLT